MMSKKKIKLLSLSWQRPLGMDKAQTTQLTVSSDSSWGDIQKERPSSRQMRVDHLVPK